MLKNKLFYLIIVLIIILLISFWIVEENRKPESELAQKKETAEKETGEDSRSNILKEVETILFNQDDTFRWDIKSGEISSYTGQENIDFSSLEIEVYDTEESKNDRLYIFTAPQGSYNNEKARLSLEGPVKIEKNNLLFTTGYLEWWQQPNQIKGNKGVEIENPDLVLKGHSFESSSNLNNIKVSGDEKERAHLFWKENENE
ncbi:MAG: LPS export ABC transporter periplasmic protein LptC [Halanaerobiaceae bacterium]